MILFRDSFTNLFSPVHSLYSIIRSIIFFFSTLDFSWKGYNNQGMGSIFTCNLVRHKLSPDNRGKGYSIMQINRCNFSTGTVCPVYIARSGENQGKWNKGGTSLTPNDRCRFNHSPLLLIKLCRQPPSPPPPQRLLNSFQLNIFDFFFSLF